MLPDEPRNVSEGEEEEARREARARGSTHPEMFHEGCAGPGLDSARSRGRKYVLSIRDAVSNAIME